MRLPLLYTKQATVSELTVSDLRERLYRLSQNLWWSWSAELRGIFRAIDRELWRAVNHNPVEFLKRVDPKRLEVSSGDAVLLARTSRTEKNLKDNLEREAASRALNARSSQ